MVSQASKFDDWLNELRKYDRQGKYLTLRATIKRDVSKVANLSDVTRADVAELRAFVYSTPELGMDLVYQWANIDKKFGVTSRLAVQKLRGRADRKILKKKFQSAVTDYLRVAFNMKKKLDALSSNKSGTDYRELIYTYPYVLHDLGRALYGAGRYDDALKVYSWIPVNYTRLRTVLLEKMWVGIQAKRPEFSLGAWYAIRSNYFSKFIYPEEFLVAIYALQVLCLEEDAKRLYAGMKNYDLSRFSKKELFQDWARRDYETLILWNLATSPESRINSSLLKKERVKIYRHLKNGFDKELKQIKSSYKRLKAMGFLAQMPETKLKLRSTLVRDQNFDYSKLGEEYWPGGEGEIWADELASIVYVGEGACGE